MIIYSYKPLCTLNRDVLPTGPSSLRVNLAAVEVTDLPRLKRMTMKLQEFFLAQENGLELMEGVKNLSVGPEAAARRTEASAIC